jgi:hypothetical protein
VSKAIDFNGAGDCVLIEEETIKPKGELGGNFESNRRKY